MYSTTDPWLPFWTNNDFNHHNHEFWWDVDFEHLRREFKIGCIKAHVSYVCKQLTK